MFFRRFIGVLALDASIFEEIEADKRTWVHAAVVVLGAAAAARMAALELRIGAPEDFVAGAVMALGAVLVWVTAIAALGIYAFSTPETHSDVAELLRTLGFAAAPGVFLSLTAILPAVPVVAAVVVWMVAAAVIAVRQSLDYVSTVRAIAVCACAALLSLGGIAALLALFGSDVS